MLCPGRFILVESVCSVNFQICWSKYNVPSVEVASWVLTISLFWWSVCELVAVRFKMVLSSHLEAVPSGSLGRAGLLWGRGLKLEKDDLEAVLLRKELGWVEQQRGRQKGPITEQPHFLEPIGGRGDMLPLGDHGYGLRTDSFCYHFCIKTSM